MDVRTFLQWYNTDSHKQGYVAGMAIALEQRLVNGNANVHEPTRLILDSVYDPQKLTEFERQYKTPLPQTIDSLGEFKIGWMEGAQQGGSIIDEVDRNFPSASFIGEVKQRYLNVMQEFVTPAYTGQMILPKLIEG